MKFPGSFVRSVYEYLDLVENLVTVDKDVCYRFWVLVHTRILITTVTNSSVKTSMNILIDLS